jgi:hypothetical protein
VELLGRLRILLLNAQCQMTKKNPGSL